MIADQCFTMEWQVRKRAELGGCDPVLLEKTIHAFALLDAMAARGLEFVFKGGTGQRQEMSTRPARSFHRAKKMGSTSKTFLQASWRGFR